MIAGSVKAFQSHSAHRGVPITDITTASTQRRTAPGGTITLDANSPTFIEFYDGVDTTVKLPSRSSIPIGTNYIIANPGDNASFTITVIGTETGPTQFSATVSSELCISVFSCDQVHANDLFYWTYSLLADNP